VALLPTADLASAAYPPLAADGKLKVAAHPVRLENGTVELALQVLAPGKTIEAVRIDNLGGVSSLWRSDGKDDADFLSVSRSGNKQSSGAEAMNLALGDAEALLSLTLKDNGAFAGKTTDFRVTVFFAGGERAMYVLSAANFHATTPSRIAQNNSTSATQAESQMKEASGDEIIHRQNRDEFALYSIAAFHPFLTIIIRDMQRIIFNCPLLTILLQYGRS
jgi:hypothetical protein